MVTNNKVVQTIYLQSFLKIKSNRLMFSGTTGQVQTFLEILKQYFLLKVQNGLLVINPRDFYLLNTMVGPRATNRYYFSPSTLGTITNLQQRFLAMYIFTTTENSSDISSQRHIAFFDTITKTTMIATHTNSKLYPYALDHRGRKVYFLINDTASYNCFYAMPETFSSMSTNEEACLGAYLDTNLFTKKQILISQEIGQTKHPKYNLNVAIHKKSLIPTSQITERFTTQQTKTIADIHGVDIHNLGAGLIEKYTPNQRNQIIESLSTSILDLVTRGLNSTQEITSTNISIELGRSGKTFYDTE